MSALQVAASGAVGAAQGDAVAAGEFVEGVEVQCDTLNEHARDTQGVDGHSSIDAAPAGVLEVSTWSTRSAASMNDVDTDERQLIMARQGRALSSSR